MPDVVVVQSDGSVCLNGAVKFRLIPDPPLNLCFDLKTRLQTFCSSAQDSGQFGPVIWAYLAVPFLLGEETWGD